MIQLYCGWRKAISPSTRIKPATWHSTWQATLLGFIFLSFWHPCLVSEWTNNTGTLTRLPFLVIWSNQTIPVPKFTQTTPATLLGLQHDATMPGPTRVHFAVPTHQPRIQIFALLIFLQMKYRVKYSKNDAYNMNSAWSPPTHQKKSCINLGDMWQNNCFSQNDH